MQGYDFYAAVMVGLLGAGHCFGMCGGVVGAFTQAIPSQYRLSLSHRMVFTLCYNIGRISSYVIAGALVGLASSTLVTIANVDEIVSFLQLFAGLMLITMGLYIGQFNSWLLLVEKLGKPLWRKLQPLTRHVARIDSPPKSVLAGMIWGWLPCGLVYSSLTWALASADPIQGATIMLGFGLGTLPALMAMGAASQWLDALLRKKKLRIISSLVLIAYGAQMAYIALNQFL